MRMLIQTQSLGVSALKKMLTVQIELVGFRRKYPNARQLTSKADVSKALQNLRIDRDQVYLFCYTVRGLVVIELRLIFGWSGSRRVGGVTLEAAEDGHCSTDLGDVQVLPKGKYLMAHVKLNDRWEEENQTLIPQDAKSRAPTGGESLYIPGI